MRHVQFYYRESMKNKKETSWDDIKAMFQETDRRFKETDRKFKENAKSFKETEKFIKETSASIKRTERMICDANKQIGGISRSNGEFCEEYFINSFKENPTFLGEKFDRVLEYLKPEPAVVNDEYDLVLRNGSIVVLIEMKYKADIDDVKRMFLKLRSYRANYPMFKDYKVYLCIASFRFRANVRARAAKEGIVLIQQRGDKIEVVSENVKAWE